MVDEVKKKEVWKARQRVMIWEGNMKKLPTSTAPKVVKV